MALCCNNCYPICQPLASCPSAVYVKVPIDYEGLSITVNINKPGVNIQGQQVLNVGEDGFVEVDLEALPEGFFNPWGGQYSINFADSAGQVIIFTAMDGKQYDSICLTFAHTISNQETVISIINPFNNDQPI